jgi:NAD(P)H-hydrate epimerase
MRSFDPEVLKSIYIPPKDAHKPQNGTVMLIGGSHLFHAASLWSLTVISRIVDMTFYSSVEENNEIVKAAKEEFRNGIIVPRNRIDDYINEADVVLIGPGLPREAGLEEGDDDTKELTEKLLKKYPDKKWVIDGGSLQTMDPEILLGLKVMPILTPHKREFETLVSKIKDQRSKIKDTNQKSKAEAAEMFAKEYKCVVLLKGEYDTVCSPTDCVKVEGGNAGMTKGGTGDVLAGLVAALYAKNEAFLSATAASYINKKAGESLFEKVGYYFNASDLADEIPKVMKNLI